MTINEQQDEVIEEFSELDDWMDRYQLLIDLGEEQEPLPDNEKTEQNLIDGCQSRVWLVCDENNGILTFRAESDALIGHRVAAHPRGERPYATGNSRRRPLFHPRNRSDGTPLPHAQQRSAGHD